MAHLRERLDRDLAPLRGPLIVNVVAIHGGRRYFGGLSNLETTNGGIVRRKKFGYRLEEKTKPFCFGNGSGAERVVADRDLDELLDEQVNAPTESVQSEMELLAHVNRRVAEADSRVSPYCQVSFINADDRFEPATRVFTEGTESVPFHMPTQLFGIDLSFAAEQFMRRMGSGEAPDFDPDLMNKHLRRRP